MTDQRQASKPADEAAERAALIEEVLFSGESIGYQALYDDNGVLIESEFDAYSSYYSSANLEKLKLASEAVYLVLQAKKAGNAHTLSFKHL